MALSITICQLVGAVVIFDNCLFLRTIMAKQYGPAFLKSSKSPALRVAVPQLFGTDAQQV
jgi:hypothetical protein